MKAVAAKGGAVTTLQGRVRQPQCMTTRPTFSPSRQLDANRLVHELGQVQCALLAAGRHAEDLDVLAGNGGSDLGERCRPKMVLLKSGSINPFHC